MYSCVFLVCIHRCSRFFWFYSVTPVTSLSRRSQGCTEKQPASGPCLLEGGSQPENQSNSKMFWPEATFYHCCTVYKRNISPCMLLEMSIFSRHVPQYLLSANAMIGRVNTGLGPEVKFPLTVCCEFSLLTEPPRSREIWQNHRVCRHSARKCSFPATCVGIYFGATSEHPATHALFKYTAPVVRGP